MMAAGTTEIHSDQLRRYQAEGVLFPIPVLTPAEVCAWRTACDELEQALGGKPRTIDVRQMHLHFRWAWDLATHPRILDAVEKVLGPDLLIWATELFTKHPEDPSITIGWHRDHTYMRFPPHTCTTAWVALGPSVPENGCMRVVPGAGRHDQSDSTDDAIDVILKPGEMSLHDAEVLHGSQANTSREKRVGFVIRFITPEALPSVDEDTGPAAAEAGVSSLKSSEENRHSASATNAVLVRGSADGKQFREPQPPADSDLHKSLAGLKRSATQHLDAILQNL